MKTKCEIFSRVVGYLRPVSNWNEGKEEEFKDRTYFEVSEPKSRVQINIKNIQISKQIASIEKTEITGEVETTEISKNKIQSNGKVTLFKKPECNKCKALYERLKEENRDFNEKWFKDSIPELTELAKKQGIKEINTPVVVCNGKIYPEATYEKVLELING